MLLLILCQELVHKHDTCLLLCMGVLCPFLFYLSVLSLFGRCLCVFRCRMMSDSCSPIGAWSADSWMPIRDFVITSCFSFVLTCCLLCSLVTCVSKPANLCVFARERD